MFHFIILIASLTLTVNADIKNLAGPPDEFNLMRMPDAIKHSITDDSVSDLITLRKTNVSGVYFGNIEIFIDLHMNFSIMLISTIYEKLNISLVCQNELYLIESRNDFILGVDNVYDVILLYPENYEIGTCSLTILTHDVTDDDNINVLINYEINNSYASSKSNLNSYVIKFNNKIGVSAELLYNNITDIDKHILIVTEPDNDICEYLMNDEGVNGDLKKHDGVYGVEIILDEIGSYILSPTINGNFISNGTRTEFIRDSQHLITVSEANVKIMNDAKIVKISRNFYELWIHIKNFNININTFKIYTELWNVDNCGNETPIFWLGGIYNITHDIMKLPIDIKWIQRSDVCDEFVLKNTYINDLNTSFPIDEHFSDIYVSYDESYKREFMRNVSKIITDEMRGNVREYKSSSSNPGLILLPGYCSANNPWSATSSIFDNAFYFNEFNLNLSNDQYAHKVLNFMWNNNLDQVNFIAHSQGGMVAAHLYNYYINIPNRSGRLIQTVGTPFQGTILASAFASIGKFFNIGCGSNSDLSYDGAINWASGITPETRKLIYSYSTTGDCSFVMNLILSPQNDGIVELSRTKLSGINYISNTNNQCHTTNMNKMAQYLDKSRNEVMNKLKSR